MSVEEKTERCRAGRSLRGIVSHLRLIHAQAVTATMTVTQGMQAHFRCYNDCCYVYDSDSESACWCRSFPHRTSALYYYAVPDNNLVCWYSVRDSDSSPRRRLRYKESGSEAIYFLGSGNWNTYTLRLTRRYSTMFYQQFRQFVTYFRRGHL